MRKHQEAYRLKLGAMTEGELRRSNLGFTLARVKRDILVEAKPHWLSMDYGNIEKYAKSSLSYANKMLSRL